MLKDLSVTLKINGKEILSKLVKEKSDKKRTTLWVSEAEMNRLNKVLEGTGIAPSNVINELIKMFNDSVKS